MNKALWELIRMALQTSGLNPESNMAMIGERLTRTQYDVVFMFLKWLEETGNTVGDANYKKVFNKFFNEKNEEISALV